MKWFIGLNAVAPQFSEYARMIRVAVWTARRFTELEPVLLFDGPSCELTKGFESSGGTVVFMESRFKPDLLRLAAERDNPEIGLFGPGAYLRLEVPAIAATMAGKPEPVLYTDCDIMFDQGFDIDALPRFETPIAVGPGSDDARMEDWNSGVMFFNLERYFPIEEEMVQFMREDLHHAVRHNWDQYSLLRYFRKPETYTFLLPRWNWKAYWRLNPRACVIHFHGPKPFHRKFLNTPNFPAKYQPLLNNFYFQHAARWDQYQEQSIRSGA